MKKCLLCKKKLGLIKFKTLDGYVCKTCYKIVSLDYSRTITQLEPSELKSTWQKYKSKKQNQVEFNFEITRKVNGYVLFDDLQQKLCLPNNSRYTLENLAPEYYKYDDVHSVETVDESASNEKKNLRKLNVKIIFKNPDLIVRNIVLISDPVDVRSNIYRTMKTLADRICTELCQLNENNREKPML